MTTFQLLKAALPGKPSTVLGLWETLDTPSEAAPSGDAVSFAALDEGPAGDEVPVWRVDVDADAALSARQLEAGLREVAAAEGALGEARARLEALATQAGPGGAISFDAEQALPPAEQAALHALEQLRRERAGVSFDLLRPEEGGAAEAERRFQAVVERLSQALLFYAVVETHVAGRLAARTAVSWSADAQTLWPAGPVPELLGLHTRTLRLSLASRAALIRTFLLAAQGAVKLAAALATPGGALLALPIAWKFVNQVLAEAGQFHKFQNDLQGA